MKRRNYLWIVSLLTGLLLAIITGYGLYRYRYATYKNMVSHTLKIALLQELEPVEAEPVIYSTNEMNDEIDSATTDTLLLTTTTSEKQEKHYVDAALFQHNIAQDGALLGLHSYQLYKKPVVADSLYKRWETLLSDNSTFRTDILLRLTTSLYKRWETLLSDNSTFRTDILLRLTTRNAKTGGRTVFVPSNASRCDADSLCTWYAGGYCELEATAYACPIGCRLLTAWDWLILLFAFVLCPFIYLDRHRFCSLRTTSLVREAGKPIGEESGKETHANESSQNIVYTLGENVYFDVSAMTLSDKFRKRSVDLQPMEAGLLKCLREAEGCRMDKEALLHELWSDNAGMYSLHSSVSRLRKKLKAISQAEIKNQGRYYILIF